MASIIPSHVVQTLAPTGKLRAAINFGNTVLAQKDPATGEPRGVSGELAREFAKRLGIPIEFGISRSWRSIRCGPPRSISRAPTC
jgi:polar amino acid transport system substrate-binding protein